MLMGTPPMQLPLQCAARALFARRVAEGLRREKAAITIQVSVLK